MREISNLMIAGQAWLMNERVATLLYHQYMTGGLQLIDLKAKAQLHANLAAMGQRIGTYTQSYKVKSKSGQNVAVMPVYGTLTKRGEMCSYGMRDYMSEIEALNANEEIVAIVMEMEGPGGTVDGTNEFGMAVRASKKPIVAFGDNMVASADYWVASQAKYIFGNKNNPTEFGSIGVLCVHEYWGKFIEENIGQVKIIRAPQSKDKARVNPIEELTPDLEQEIVADLKDCASSFFAAVKKGRGAALTEDEKVWGTGKMYKPKDALGMGLIDAVGNLMDAINKAAELSGGSSTKSNNANNKSMKTKTVAGNLLSKLMGTKGKAADGGEPAAAATDSTPLWTADMVFNTDGSGDGQFCLHEDTDGNQRKWETKIDNNQGNEPPSDPTVFEDDNWVDVEDEQEPEEPAPAGEANTTIGKLNAALIKSKGETKAALADAKALRAEVNRLRAEKKANANKPAAPATTVISPKGDKNPADGSKKMSSYEKKARRKVGAAKDEDQEQE